MAKAASWQLPEAGLQDWQVSMEGGQGAGVQCLPGSCVLSGSCT